MFCVLENMGGLVMKIFSKHGVITMVSAVMPQHFKELMLDEFLNGEDNPAELLQNSNLFGTVSLVN